MSTTLGIQAGVTTGSSLSGGSGSLPNDPIGTLDLYPDEIFGGYSTRRLKGVFPKLLPADYSGARAAYSLRKVRSDYPQKLPAAYGDGAAAAYSLRKVGRYDGPAINVRRSSDDATQDIGFSDIGGLDTTALLAFVNEDVDVYTSDFTSGNEDLLEVNGTGADGQSIAGVDDAYKFTLSSGSANHRAQINSAFDLVNTYDVSFEYYIPSGQTINGIRVRTGDVADGGYDQTTLDAWTTVTIQDWKPTSSTAFRIYALVTPNTLIIDADDDVFYLKNIVITQTTADGHVTTWYDQSGNGNSATNSTASQQPLVVSAGTVVTETNGLPAISWESNDLALLRIPWNATSSQSWFGVFNPLNDSYIAISEIPAGGRRDWVVQDGSTSTSLNGFNNQQGTLFINSEGQSPTTRDDLHTAFSTQGNVLATTIDLDNSTWNDGSDWYFFGNGGGVGNLFNYSGRVQEWIVFESDQSANRTGIEGNIGRYYNIDGFTDGRVATWYDQANANHATQSTPDEQPLIVSDGALVLENSKPAIQFDGVDDQFDMSVGITSGFGIFGVYKNTKASSYLIGDSPELGRRSNDQYRFRDGVGFSTGANGGTHSDNQVLIAGLEDGANARVYANGVEQASIVSSFASATLIQIGKNFPDGTFQEIIIYSSDQSDNRQDIEKNIADYYEITLSGNSGVESWVKNVSFADMYQIWFDYEYLHRLFANFEIPNQVHKILAYSDELTADQRQQVYDYLQKNYHPIYTAFSNRVLADGGTLAAGQTNTLTIIDSI